MPDFNRPALPNAIAADVPDLQQLLRVLATMDYAGATNIPAGALRWNGNNMLFEIYNGTSWASLGKLAHDVETVDGKSANASIVKDTIPVRDANGRVPGDITGNAATANSAGTLSATLTVDKGGTGGTTSAAARVNLGVGYGTAEGTVCQGNDSRLSDARTPETHASTHKTGGSDALTAADIGAAAPADVVKKAGDAMAGNLTPETDGTPSLGTASLRWLSGYFKNIFGVTAAGRTVQMFPRERLRAATAFYVSTSGNDSKDGRSPADAMLSFDSLMARLYQEYDLNGQTVTVSIASGTYTDQEWTIARERLTNPGHIVIQGAGVDSTILSASNGTTTSRNGIRITYHPAIQSYTAIDKLTITNANNCIAVYGGYVRLGDITFGPHFTANSGYDVYCDGAGRVGSHGGSGANKTLTFAGADSGQGSRIAVAADSYMHFNYLNLTIASAMTVNRFLYATAKGQVFLGGAANTVITGASLLTGQRVLVENDAFFHTGGRGESVLPGSTAGSKANGGTIDNAGSINAAACSGNAATATKWASARTIAISGAVTGTATSFDGSANITIPITALDVSKATAGTLPVARGGTGLTAGGAPKPQSAAGAGQWVKLYGGSSITLPSGGTWAFFAFGGTHNGNYWEVMTGNATVAAGGSSAGVTGASISFGFAWRIA